MGIEHRARYSPRNISHLRLACYSVRVVHIKGIGVTWKVDRTRLYLRIMYMCNDKQARLARSVHITFECAGEPF